jgi:hypothetical protein
MTSDDMQLPTPSSTSADGGSTLAPTVTPGKDPLRAQSPKNYRIYNLSYQHGMNPDFIFEFHALLQEMAALPQDERCGLAWNENGTSVRLSDAPKFQKYILQKSQLFSADDDQQAAELAEWEGALKTLQFDVTEIKVKNQDPQCPPLRLYAHPKFRRNSTVEELKQILPTALSNKKRELHQMASLSTVLAKKPRLSTAGQAAEREIAGSLSNEATSDLLQEKVSPKAIEPIRYVDTLQSPTPLNGQKSPEKTLTDCDFQDSVKVTDDEEDGDESTAGYSERIDLDQIVVEWKVKNAKTMSKQWNSWYGGEKTFVERKLRLWCSARKQFHDKRMVLVLMSGRGAATTVEEMKEYTPQLRRETARCLVLEKLLPAQVHTLDKRTIRQDVRSPYYHQGDMNDLRRMTSERLLQNGRFDEIVMDYVWWENAYVQDRVTDSFFGESIPKLLQSCKPGGSIFLPCTPYMFAQSVLAIQKCPSESDFEGDNDEVLKKTVDKSWTDEVAIELMTEADAASQIAFWHATEVIRGNNYLLSKNPSCLTENIGMGDGRGALKSLQQVCSSLSNASVNFVLAEYKRLKVNKPMFIRVFKDLNKEQGGVTTMSMARNNETQQVDSATVPNDPVGLPNPKASQQEAPLNLSNSTDHFVGQRVAMSWEVKEGIIERYLGTVKSKKVVLGRDTYEVVFDRDGSTFAYFPKDVREGIAMYGKREWELNSRILGMEYIVRRVPRV